MPRDALGRVRTAINRSTSNPLPLVRLLATRLSLRLETPSLRGVLALRKERYYQGGRRGQEKKANGNMNDDVLYNKVSNDAGIIMAIIQIADSAC